MHDLNVDVSPLMWNPFGPNAKESEPGLLNENLASGFASYDQLRLLV
jgi:hypothetical protein